MRKSICVIDDDVIYQKIIKKLIDQSTVFGKAYFYTRAKEALSDLAEIQTEFPSVILLDINMPIMDGWQCLDYLETLFPELYEIADVYIVSSSIAFSDKEKIKEYPGVSGFLSKPMKVEMLKRIGKRLK
ncbi:response regulator [Christiangramia sp.]|uniref:response regulator n=1 Tax=Christiangramia sp. TaxID=1931228 RepID=UPI002614671E|nr:response regulator [Christiangramia sp.]